MCQKAMKSITAQWGYFVYYCRERSCIEWHWTVSFSMLLYV